MEIDLRAEFAASTREISESIKGLNRYWRTPFHLKEVQSAVAGATSPTLLDFGGPSVGMEWNPIVIVVVGSDDHTQIVGTNVAAYIGDPQSAGLNMVLDPSLNTTVPSVATYPREAIWVKSQEHLFLLVYGLPQGQNVTAIAYIDLYYNDEVEPRMG